MHALHTAVDGAMRRIGRDVLLPRFRNLDAAEIEEKAPNDYVTVVDRESERQLSAALTTLLPGSRVVGEEGVAADPSLVDGITDGCVWIVDPLDGTGNYTEGKTPFAMMVALAEEGVVQAGWILDPVTRRMCHAARGQGAYIDARRVYARATGEALPVAALGTRYLPVDVRADMLMRIDSRITEADIPNCAGEQYPLIVLGAVDVALFWRTKPWDHAPGALFVEEAGGKVARPDGSAYWLGDERTGLLAAASPRLWYEAATILFEKPPTEPTRTVRPE